MRWLKDIFHNRKDYDKFYFLINGYLFLIFELSHIMMEIIFLYLDIPIMVFYNIVPIVLLLVCIYLNHIGLTKIAAILTIIELCIFSILGTLVCGWNLGFYLYFFVAVAFAFFTQILCLRTKAFVTIVIAVLAGILKVYAQGIGVSTENFVITFIYSINFLGIILNTAMIYYYFDSQGIELAKETNKSKQFIKDIERILEKNMAISNEVKNIGEQFLDNFNGNLRSQNAISSSSEVVAINSRSSLETNQIISTRVHDFSVMIENLKDSVGHIHKNSKEALDLNNKGNGNILDIEVKLDKNIESTNKLGNAIVELEERAVEIETIIDVIKSITKQINLLSLNASIEASRAGEHGKGFAVVSDEIRKLAEQSSNATSKIEEVINSVKISVEGARLNMNEVGIAVNTQKSLTDETKTRFDEIKIKIDLMTSEINSVNSDIHNITNFKEEIKTLVQKSAKESESVYQETEKIVVSIKEQSNSMYNSNSIVEELLSLSSKLNSSTLN
jgi:methyl-accepting chemotaxis protein